MAVGFTQLVTRCDQYATSVPYFPFRKLLRPLAGITEWESAAEAGARLKPWVEAVMPDFAPGSRCSPPRSMPKFRRRRKARRSGRASAASASSRRSSSSCSGC